MDLAPNAFRLVRGDSGASPEVRSVAKKFRAQAVTRPGSVAGVRHPGSSCRVGSSRIHRRSRGHDVEGRSAVSKTVCARPPLAGATLPERGIHRTNTSSDCSHRRSEGCRVGEGSGEAQSSLEGNRFCSSSPGTSRGRSCGGSDSHKRIRGSAPKFVRKSGKTASRSPLRRGCDANIRTRHSRVDGDEKSRVARSSRHGRCGICHLFDRHRSRALEEAGVQVALIVADPSTVGSSVVVERGGHQGQSQGRFAVMATDADDSDVQHCAPSFPSRRVGPGQCRSLQVSSMLGQLG